MLKHHIVRIHFRHLQTTEITGNALVYGLRQNGCPLCVRVYRILQHVWIRIKRLVEVYQLYTFCLSDTFNGQLDFIVPVTSTRLETPMTIRQRSHSSQEETHLRIHLTERLHQGTVITDKFVSVVRPVAWVGIVDAEMYHYDVTGKSQGILILLLLGIRAMSLVQQSSSRLTEVTYFVLLTQHALQLHRISIYFSISNT